VNLPNCHFWRPQISPMALFHQGSGGGHFGDSR
jgi:hypothetical protein